MKQYIVIYKNHIYVFLGVYDNESCAHDRALEFCDEEEIEFTSFCEGDGVCVYSLPISGNKKRQIRIIEASPNESIDLDF